MYKSIKYAKKKEIGQNYNKYTFYLQRKTRAVSCLTRTIFSQRPIDVSKFPRGSRPFSQPVPFPMSA